MYKVSIIIPVYNGEEYLDKCLESILKQTYKNIEIICINDGSTDNSEKKLKKYQNEYKNIFLYKQKNSGQAIARNNGIKLAKGKYIMFIDQDDFIEKDYVEKYVETIIENNFDIVIGGYKRINQDGKIKFEIRNNKKRDNWFKYTIIAPWAKLYKKEILIKYKSQFLNYKIGEDIYFSLGLYSQNLNIGIINYSGYYWFFNDKSISNTLHRGLREEIDVEKLLNKILEYNTRSNKEKKYLEYFIYRFCLYYLLTSGKYSSKEKFIKEYLRLNDWLSKNLDNNIVIPKSETVKIKLCIKLFKIIKKTKLINFFSSIYCER